MTLQFFRIISRIGYNGTKQTVKSKAGRIADYDAHSPMFRNRNFSEERRSRLFDDSPFKWGRLPKFILAWMLCQNLWSGYYVYHKHALTMHNQEQTKKAFRKVTPFVQAMEDIRYVSLQQRNYMILKAICDAKDPRHLDFLRSRYNQTDMFSYAVKGANHRGGYDGRFGTSRYWNIKNYRKPEDEEGLVGFQEVSHY